eukprot:CAMPEP_0119412914 /NCGR_PEP_ID=MMETSP1335-20130426/5185_1 /TAXON_ID=259385 /ORGANISM="Chrysoculter rhomboideus, Strain RCC1486" /LENGTH=38 /DNA_ID= /DNA_START= /DNA_END= /DNA_ORIENTATION=
MWQNSKPAADRFHLGEGGEEEGARALAHAPVSGLGLRL